MTEYRLQNFDKKIYLIGIKRKLPSHWKSCRVITKSLINSYESFARTKGLNFKVFKYCDKTADSYSTLQKSIKQLSKIGRVMIFFIDHLLPPHQIPGLLNEKFEWENIDLMIHIFGDFTIRPKEWIENQNSYLGKKVTFIAPSSRSMNLINRLTKEQSTLLIPYPVRTEFLSNTANFFEESDKIRLVYAGRLTPQKNIIGALKVIDQVNCIFDNRLEVHICGNFDNRGSELFSLTPHREWNGFVKLLLQKSYYHFHGDLKKEQLIQLYDRCHYFFSLSTFHDEDFGIAPAEALARGCKLLLTSWGGYADFPTTHTLHIPTKMSLKGRKPHYPSFFKTLVDLINTDPITKQPFSFDFSAYALETLSHQSSHFSGFSNLFLEYNNEFINNQGSPYAASQNLHLYERIYEDYH